MHRSCVAPLLLASFLTACGPAPVTRTPSGARTATVVVGAAAGVAAASALGFTIASEAEDAAIRDGGFATGGDIGAAANRGDTFNQAAFVSSAVALGALAAAVGLYLYSTAPSAPPKERAGIRRSGSGFAF